jgi:hypothetical protein
MWHILCVTLRVPGMTNRRYPQLLCHACRPAWRLAEQYKSGRHGEALGS